MTPAGTTRMSRILVVDDEPHIARIVQLKLSDGPFLVESCLDGAQALDRLRGGETVDIILLDIMMPGMDGLEVLAAIRELPAYRQTPVIMLTAKGQQTDRSHATALGASDFLTKPFSPKKLLARIEDLLPA